VPGLGLDDGVDRLAPLVRRHAEHGGVHDVGMGMQDRLDLRGVDVHPAADDHVVLAVADVDVALVVDVGDVTHGLPAITVADGIGGAVVAVEGQGAADEELAGFAGGQLLAAGSHDLDLHGAVGPAAGARLPQLVLGRQDRVNAQLGRAVDLEQEAVAQLGDDLLLQRVGDGRGVGHQRPHRRQVGTLQDVVRQGHDPLELRRRRERVGDPVPAHEVDPAFGVEVAEQNDAAAQDVGEGRPGQRARVVEGTGGDVDLLAGAQPQLLDKRHDQGRVGRRAQRPLGLASRARGVDHRRPRRGVAHGGRLGVGGLAAVGGAYEHVVP
jgi:hypothetical protein